MNPRGHWIDLNCDLGEGAGQDADLMPLATSANIACGGHAGDAATMRATVALAQRHGTAVGAHPGFADRAHFGRRELALAPGEITALVRTQTQQLMEMAALLGAQLHHVKPHGALYNLAARDHEVARAIATAVSKFADAPLIYALAGGALVRAARELGVPVAEEFFADRTYRADGSLTPRDLPGALIHDEAAAAQQVIRMVREGAVRTIDGDDFPLLARTVCLHGDGPHAVAFARRLRRELAAAGIEVRPVTAADCIGESEGNPAP